MAGIKVVLRHKPDSEEVVFEMPKEPFKSKLIDILDKCDNKTNGYVSMNIDRPYKPRTTGQDSQNNLVWKLISIIAEEVGDDSPKYIDTENGLKERALSRGYPSKISKITGKPIPASMKNINTMECSYLIETAYQICSELGIVLEPELVREEPKPAIIEDEAENLADFALEQQKVFDELGGGLF